MKLSVQTGEPLLALSIRGIEGDELKFDFHCTACGGHTMELREHLDQGGGDMRMGYCGACDAWLGRLAAIKIQMQLLAQQEGYPPPVDPIR